MLTLIAGCPPELAELESDYRTLGIPQELVRAATYESFRQIPPDDLQDDTIVLELSSTTPGVWGVVQTVRKLALQATLKLLYRGTPNQSVELELLRRAEEVGATELIIVSATNPGKKRDQLRRSAGALVPTT